MPSTVPSYASQFRHLILSFPSENVLHVQLNRPPVNALNEQFWHEYGTAFDHIAEDPTVRVVVLSSAVEKAFSAGVDLSTLLALPQHADPGRRAFQMRTYLRFFQSAINAPARIPQPVIAAVHGPALGLGLNMLSAVDVRFAASDVSFSIKEVDVGLAADMGTLARLPKLCGGAGGNASLLHELAFSGRAFGADEASALGLVSRVVRGSRAQVVREALEFARVVAAKSPVAVVGIKRFIAHAMDHSVEDALEYQATWGAFALQSKDLSESAAAARRKQKISYDNLGESKRNNKAKL
ncbi:ClpP/crotonase [Russula compacta]|nr:ClpP/crotonase [Russula compacta]